MLSIQLEKDSHDQGLASKPGQNKTVHEIKEIGQPVSLTWGKKKNSNTG